MSSKTEKPSWSPTGRPARPTIIAPMDVEEEKPVKRQRRFVAERMARPPMGASVEDSEPNP